MFQAPTAPAPTPAAPVIPPSAPPPAPLTPPTRRASRTPLVVLVILLVLAALGVGGYFAYGAWQQATNPQGLVEESMKAMAKVSSASLTLDADVTVTPEGSAEGAKALGGAPKTFAVNVQASYVNDPANPQVDAEFTFTLPVGMELGPLGAMTLNPKISVRKKTAETIYFRVDQLPPLPFFDLSKVSGQWVKIDMAELKQKYGVSFDGVPKQDASSAAQGEKVAKIYREHPFLALTRLAAEAVDGVQTDHLRFSLDRERLKDFLNALAQEMGQPPATPEQLAQIDELFDQGLAVNGELWIGQQDHFLRQVTGSLATNVPDTGKLTANLRETFTNINQPVTVEEPADSISLEEAMQLLQAPSATSFDQSITVDGSGEVGQQRLAPERYYAPDGSVEVVDGGADSDGDGLSNFREQVLGSDDASADSDGDKFPDGEEVAKGFNPSGAGKLTPQQQEILSRFR